MFDSWSAVFDAAGDAIERAPDLFSRLTWFRLLAEHAPPPGQLLAARSGAGQESWLFLLEKDGRARAYANWYSLRFAGLGPPEGLADIARALRARRLRSVDLAPLGEDDPLPTAFRNAGWLVFESDATASWRIDTDGMTFETYWANRSSQLRNTARRKTKAASLSIALFDSFEQSAWADYETVYRGSWKPEEGSPAFLKALAEQEGAAGRLRLGIAYKDGEPIAAQLWLVEGGVAWIHKLAYVEAARGLSPGTILSVEMFRHVLDVDRVKRIDFGTGDDAYKAEWMDRKVMLKRMVAFNPATAAGLAGAARTTASVLVRRLRRH